MQNCRVSGKPLHLINDFGDQPLGNGFIESKDTDKEYFYKMIVLKITLLSQTQSLLMRKL